MAIDTSLLAYAIPAVPIWIAYGARRRALAKRHLSIVEEAQEAGLTEPNSLHPVIDTAACIGCSACVRACPEGEVLGLLEGKASLIDPTRCIGHGACQQACPTGALSLVFGTATRGVDIPFVGSDFQTNVPGIYLAGEIGGMGLIRNAVKQGVEAVEAITVQTAIDPRPEDADMLDLLIVGAGPAGIAASLAATEQGLRFETVEQDSLGGTTAHYPRSKLVMTEPAMLPLYGPLKFKEIRKEALLDVWTDVIESTGLNIRFQERVDQVRPEDDCFTVETSKGEYRARRILLAIGRLGTPRMLGVPGEERSKVVYRLVDAAQYRGRQVLVVGGGDSALEAAIALAEEPGTQVTLAYRGEAFSRARRQNREAVQMLADEGRVRLLFNTVVTRIDGDSVTLSSDGGERRVPNSDVIICAGGVLPTGFLMDIGVRIERRFGLAGVQDLAA
jgi:thioredoxin reductase (NADPH)